MPCNSHITPGVWDSFQIPQVKRKSTGAISPEGCCQDGEASGNHDVLGTAKRTKTDVAWKRERIKTPV